MTIECIFEVIKEILYNNGKSTEGIELVTNKTLNDYTIWLYTTALFKIKLGKIKYIYIKKEFKGDVGTDILVEDVKSLDGWVRLKLDTIENIKNIEDVVIKIYEQVNNSDEFACCHLYEECSEIGKCISLRKERARSCLYRKNLEAGLNFYSIK